MKKIALLSLSLFLVFISCKKNNDNPDTDPINVETPATKHPDGYLKHYQTLNLKPIVAPVVKYNTRAYFYSSSTASDFVSIDSMSLNNIYLLRTKDSTYYSDKTIPGTLCNWHVEGKRGIPDFDYNNFPIPDYIVSSNIPDSVNLKQDLSISLAGSGNFTEGTFTIYDVVGKSISKTIQPGSANIVFTAAELSTFNKYANFYFYINFTNLKTDSIAKKLFHFENQVLIDKYVVPYE